MQVAVKQEFLCPHCGGINSYVTTDVTSLKEDEVTCSHCNRMLFVIAAAGLDDTINLVISECEDEATIR